MNAAGHGIFVITDATLNSDCSGLFLADELCGYTLLHLRGCE